MEFNQISQFTLNSSRLLRILPDFRYVELSEFVRKVLQKTTAWLLLKIDDQVNSGMKLKKNTKQSAKD